MVNGIPEVQAMFRRKAAAVVAAGKAAARKGGEDVAAAARYLAPSSGEGKLRRSIRVEDLGVVSLSARKKGAYASREGNQSFRENTNRTANFIGVKVVAGDATTLVKGDRNTMFQNAKLQEFGTKNMPANPFFFPAWRQNRTRIKAAMTRAIQKAWTSE